MDYHDFGRTLADEHPKSRTISGTFEGRKIWIKRPVPPKSRIWHSLQRLIAFMCGKQILRATVSRGGSRSLYLEAERLRAFKGTGFCVPDVLAIHDDMLILGDAGEQLRSLIDDKKDMADRKDLLAKAILNLAALHKAGLAHGRPYIRDMVWTGEQVGFLDLEENPVIVMDPAVAQARDVWIFLGAASRYARDKNNKLSYDKTLIQDLYKQYNMATGKDVERELKRFVRFLSPLLPLFEAKKLWPVIGTDARQAVITTRALKDYFED